MRHRSIYTIPALARELGTTANVVRWVIERDRLATTEHGDIDDATAEAIELGLGDDINSDQQEQQCNGK